MRILAAFGIAASVLLPLSGIAQELHGDVQGVWKAEVIEIPNERTETIPWNGTEVTVQVVRAKLLEGVREGETVEFTNDYIELEEGDVFFMNYMVTVDGDELYSVRDVDRTPALIFFSALFAAVILAFGGRQGLRSLLSLAGSLLVVVYVLLPALIAGYPPVVTSTAIAGVILFVAIFFTHGFNRSSAIAFAGTAASIAFTGALALAAVSLTNLTGFGTEESVYLNLNTAGRLDFAGLLLGGIIIGILGVLDDIAITQVAVVREIKSADPKLGRKEVYVRALAVGREHVSALVNTLVLAYAGTALPLLMLLSISGSSFREVANQEAFASEIIRTIVGSIGLILTVPVTTALAVAWISGNGQGERSPHVHGHKH